MNLSALPLAFWSVVGSFMSLKIHILSIHVSYHAVHLAWCSPIGRLLLRDVIVFNDCSLAIALNLVPFPVLIRFDHIHVYPVRCFFFGIGTDLLVRLIVYFFIYLYLSSVICD